MTPVLSNFVFVYNLLNEEQTEEKELKKEEENEVKVFKEVKHGFNQDTDNTVLVDLYKFLFHRVLAVE